MYADEVPRGSEGEIFQGKGLHLPFGGSTRLAVGRVANGIDLWQITGWIGAVTLGLHLYQLSINFVFRDFWDVVLELLEARWQLSSPTKLTGRQKKGGFVKGWFWRMYPRSGFRSGGTSAETTLLETTLLRTPEKGHWEIKGRFPKGWFWRTDPRSGFRSGGTSAETTLLETALLRTPEKPELQSWN